MTTDRRVRRRSAALGAVVGSAVAAVLACAALATPAAAVMPVAAVPASAVPATALPASALPATARAGSLQLAAAGLPAQQFGCQPTVAVTTADTHSMAFLDHEDLTGEPVALDQIAPATGVSALGSTSYDIVQSSQRWYVHTFAVRNGSLTYELSTYPNTVPTQMTHSTKVLGGGWGNVTKLVDASDLPTQITKGGWLYALNPTAGTLSRYSVSEPRIGSPVVRSNASRPGYAGFRSLALAYRYRQGYPGAADVLIGTTRAGALYLITIPASGAFAPRLTLLRASTWVFDDLVVGECGGGLQYSLLAVRKATRTAYLYRIDTIAGTSSRMRGYGALASPWDFTHTSGLWLGGLYPGRW